MKIADRRSRIAETAALLGHEYGRRCRRASFAEAFARIGCRYFANGAFLRSDFAGRALSSLSR